MKSASTNELVLTVSPPWRPSSYLFFNRKLVIIHIYKVQTDPLDCERTDNILILIDIHKRYPFILEKYGNPYQNPTASIKSYWELGSRVPPQFPGLVLSLAQLSPSLLPHSAQSWIFS